MFDEEVEDYVDNVLVEVDVYGSWREYVLVIVDDGCVDVVLYGFGLVVGE